MSFEPHWATMLFFPNMLLIPSCELGKHELPVPCMSNFTNNFNCETNFNKVNLLKVGSNVIVPVLMGARPNNFFFQVQNAMQSMHWHSHQIIILVHISYCLNLDYELYDEDSKVLIEYYFDVLDDQKQNNEFVQY